MSSHCVNRTGASHYLRIPRNISYDTTICGVSPKELIEQLNVANSAIIGV